jgi:hypothetical protein
MPVTMCLPRCPILPVPYPDVARTPGLHPFSGGLDLMLEPRSSTPTLRIVRTGTDRIIGSVRTHTEEEKGRAGCGKPALLPIVPARQAKGRKPGGERLALQLGFPIVTQHTLRPKKDAARGYGAKEGRAGPSGEEDTNRASPIIIEGPKSWERAGPSTDSALRDC